MATPTQPLTFTVDPVARERAQHWGKYHGRSDEPDTLCKGGLQYRFDAESGGIGLRIIAACMVCGSTLDVTDYDSW